MIAIRPATPDDAPAMARVIVDTWFAAHTNQVSERALQRRKDEWGYAESEQGWLRSLRAQNDGSAYTLVATRAGQVIAVAASELSGIERAEVGALYVDARYQRSGIGRRLLDAMFDYYTSLGMTTLHIAVLASNAPARRFYERLGGERCGTRDDPDGLEIVYEWRLS